MFKTTVYEGDKNIENVLKQNKRIAKEMRNKNICLTEYPCENVEWLDNEHHEFVFCEITKPMWMKQLGKEDEEQENVQQNDKKNH